MSASILYHAYGIKGVQYKSTLFQKNSITYVTEMAHQKIACPKCGCSNTCFKGQKKRTFKMIPIGRKESLLEVLLHRVECAECKYRWWPRLSFMKGKSRMTPSFKTHVLDLLQFSTLQDVSRFVKVSWNVIKGIHKEKLRKIYKKIDLKDLEYITIDEFSIRKGHSYMTVFTDLKSGRIIHAVEGRKMGDIAPFLKKLSLEAPNLKAISMDMSQCYYPAAQEFLPHVDVVFDHFHITALLNKAVDEVRKNQQGVLNQETGSKSLKGERFLFLRNYESLGSDHRARLETLLGANEPLFLAHSLKEQFRLFWQKDSREEAYEFFNFWVIDMFATGLEPLIKVAWTLNRYLDGMLNYFKHRITNAAAEGINNKIKTMKRQAYGFRDMEYFKLRLYHLHQSRYSFVG